jgi:hypothetical protein
MCNEQNDYRGRQHSKEHIRELHTADIDLLQWRTHSAIYLSMREPAFLENPSL